MEREGGALNGEGLPQGKLEGRSRERLNRGDWNQGWGWGGAGEGRGGDWV